MRLWSLSPQHLDSKGLVALWREALLAQKVLVGNTIGYKNHPQLQRFKEHPNHLGAIANYLRAVECEANERGYNFDTRKIGNRRSNKRITVTSGQVDYECQHLLKKLKLRDPERYERLLSVKAIEIHPLFEVVDGGVEEWENL